MSHIIGLSSIRPSGSEMVYLQVAELVNETLFGLERCMRKVIQSKPLAQWQDFVGELSNEGFASIADPQDHPVFIHSRPWDEHLVPGVQSFFVTFPNSAPFELAGKLLLATNHAPFYAQVSADYMGKTTVVLINVDHEPVYPEDTAWASVEYLEKVGIGPVIVPREQFADESEYKNATAALVCTGYELIA